MFPVKTAQTNFTLIGKGDVDDLPVSKFTSQYGRCVESCWKMTWMEWLRVLFTRRVYLIAMGGTHPPVYLGSESDAAQVARNSEGRELLED